MKRVLLAAAAFAALASVTAASAKAEETTLRVHYSIPNLWSEIKQKLATEFMARNPDIKIELDAPEET